MSYQAQTKRARGGAFNTVAQNTQVAVQIPAGTTSADITSTQTGARFLVANTNATVAKTAGNMGYLVANLTVSLKVVLGTDNYIILNNDSTTAAPIYITFFN